MLSHGDFYFKDFLSHTAIKLIFIYIVNMTLASYTINIFYKFIVNAFNSLPKLIWYLAILLDLE